MKIYAYIVTTCLNYDHYYIREKKFFPDYAFQLKLKKQTYYTN